MANTGIIYNVMRKLNDIFYIQQNQHKASCNQKKWKWDITQITTSFNLSQWKYAILILNRPISQNQEFITEFWNKATVRMTVDGGTNRWDKYISNLTQDVQNSLKVQTLVTGDFDSISYEMLEKYKKKGCKTVHTPDQNYTDFTKALVELNSYCQEHNIEVDHVVAIAQASGRVDHFLGNIQTLFLNKDHGLLNPDTGLYIISDDAISWLLPPGEHVISIPEDSRTHKRSWCSLVPIGETCVSVTSTGLKWNLDDQPLKFGELISTSNTFDGSETVTIICSHTLLWSMRVPSLLRTGDTGPNAS